MEEGRGKAESKEGARAGGREGDLEPLTLEEMGRMSREELVVRLIKGSVPTMRGMGLAFGLVATV
eukprot:332590-Rhodomonas_salina.1